MTIINMAGGKSSKPIVVEAVEDTPSTLPHTYTPREGVDYLSSVTVGKDPNLVPGNVKKDVSIFGTVGTYEPQISPINTEKLGLARSGLGFNLSFPSSVSLEWIEYESENPMVFGYSSSFTGYIAYQDFIIQGWASTINTSVNVNKLIIPTHISNPITISGEYLCNYTNNADFITGFPLSNGDIVDMQGYIVSSANQTFPLVNENNPMRVRGVVENGGIRVTFPEITLTFVSSNTLTNLIFAPYIATKVTE